MLEEALTGSAVCALPRELKDPRLLVMPLDLLVPAADRCERLEAAAKSRTEP